MKQDYKVNVIMWGGGDVKCAPYLYMPRKKPFDCIIACYI
jgi:hypothetical protein